MSELTEELKEVIDGRGGSVDNGRIEQEEISEAVEKTLNDLGLGAWRVERDDDYFKYRLKNLQVLIMSVR